VIRRLALVSAASSALDFGVTYYGMHHGVVDLNRLIMFFFYHHILFLWYPVEVSFTLTLSLFIYVLAGRMGEHSSATATITASLPAFAFLYDVVFLIHVGLL